MTKPFPAEKARQGGKSPRMVIVLAASTALVIASFIAYGIYAESPDDNISASPAEIEQAQKDNN